MPSSPFDVDSLLQPLGEAEPSGADRVYEAAFIELEQAVAGKPERQYGDKVYPAEPPDWPAVHEQALALAAGTRDLRIGIWLLRSATRLHGLRGASAGLRLIDGLLNQFWASVHPQLDASDGNDPTMRLNALMPLTSSANAVLADLRGAALGSARGSLTLRELELGLRRAEPLPGEAQPTEAGVMSALNALRSSQPELTEQAAAALTAVQGISTALTQHVGAPEAADLAPVLRLLKMLNAALSGQTADDAADDTTTADARATGGDAAASAPPGSVIRSRADAVRELDRVCDWLEQHEPANPAPLLIRRAQRLMNKSFMEIIRDLAPDGVAQIENLAGPDGAA